MTDTTAKKQFFLITFFLFLKTQTVRFLDWALTDDWRKAWKWLSLYGYVAVILSPEIFQSVTDLMATFDGTQADKLILPASFVSFLRTVGTVGMVVRLIRQTKQKIDDTAATIAAAQAATEAAQAAVKDVAKAVDDVQVAVAADAAKADDTKS